MLYSNLRSARSSRNSIIFQMSLNFGKTPRRSMRSISQWIHPLVAFTVVVLDELPFYLKLTFTQLRVVIQLLLDRFKESTFLCIAHRFLNDKKKSRDRQLINDNSMTFLLLKNLSLKAYEMYTLISATCRNKWWQLYRECNNSLGIKNSFGIEN